jgi:ergothioneine biosynthesis protein EgtB
MNLKYLNNKQVDKLKTRNNTLSKEKLLENINKQREKTILFIQSLVNEDLNGWEFVNEQPHPMIFELGHITLFYMHNFLRHFIDLDINELYYEMFDSLINKPENRINSEIINFSNQYKKYKEVIDKIELFINEKNITNIESYMLNMCLLHNEMHNEVLLFLLDMIGHKSPIKNEINIFTNDENEMLNNKFIYVKGGKFFQGLNINDKENVWDNEMPKHEINVKSFYCQKYPVTNKEYIKFIDDGGYYNKNYWSKEGIKWLEKSKTNKPKFWLKKNGLYLRKHFDNVIPIVGSELNKPIVKVNYYEAEAYAKYIGGRLPNESEYEYMATNKGLTKFPWGNDENKEKYSNINYNNGDVLQVNTYKKYKNNDGIVDLMGNCWYWTSTHFHPYDCFIIDPVYDTFSYPFFYFRMIVKGAAWTCGLELAYPQYRNSQEPEKRFHYTGIRVVKDFISS